MRRLAVALLVAVLLCLPAAAAEPEEELEKRLGVSAVEEAAEELTGESVPLAGFQPETALQRLFSGLLQGEAFSRAAASGGKALLILLCCAGAESVFPLGEGGRDAGYEVCLRYACGAQCHPELSRRIPGGEEAVCQSVPLQ